jgi:hypothetical protein
MNQQATEELLGGVFSVRSVLQLYSKGQQEKLAGGQSWWLAVELYW